ncbi:DMT family transporter [Paenibacillus campi]|uniref:DMT family transporter n=1 Tax=Paenibacillus campi TaxID=3106031 RepID=UPI002B001015|nr:DMT family transporter [Paenibacillus sp. SGZ-1014]
MQQLKGKIYLLIAFTLAGTSVVTSSILSVRLHLFTITAVALGILLLCMTPFYGKQTLRTIRHMDRNDWLMLILQALIGMFVFRICLLLGVSRTSTMEAGILSGTTPMITAILAFFVLKEALTIKNVIGIGCTVTGIVLLQNTGSNSWIPSIEHIWGNMFILGAAASESLFNIISRQQRLAYQRSSAADIHPMVQVFIVSAITFGFCLIPFLLEQPVATLPLIGWNEWLGLIWYGLVITGLSFFFFYKGVACCNAYTIAAFSGMMPLTSVLLSLLILKEQTSYVQSIGGILIIVSVLLIADTRRKAETSPPPEKEFSSNMH